MGDHDDHIHVGFRPGGGVNAKGKVKGLKGARISKKDWYRVFDRLGQIENPEQMSRPSLPPTRSRWNKKLKAKD